MKKKKNSLCALASLLLCFACETEITPRLDQTLNILVVDAWLTNDNPVQHINLTRSQSYFDRNIPEKVTGASLLITDLTDGTVYRFNEEEQRYTWRSADDRPFGSIGHEYELVVQLDGNTYTSRTKLNEVPPIDSIVFRIEPGNAFAEEAIYGEFFATDLKGLNDTYWIKSWKNGRYLGKPSEINIAYDATFAIGEDNDNKTFIQPIRSLISPNELDGEGDFLSPFQLPQTYEVASARVLNEDGSQYGYIENDVLFFENANVPTGFDSVELGDQYVLTDPNTLSIKGDSVYVEIHSISNEAFFFLSQVIIEIDRGGGFEALFATPMANVSTNIVPDASENLVAGFFNVAAVSSKGVRLRDRSQIRLP